MKVQTKKNKIKKLVKILTIIQVLNGVVLSYKKKTNRRFWVRRIYRERYMLGFYETTFKSIKTYDPEMFFKSFRMDIDTFQLLLGLFESKLQKTSLRRPIEPESRLAVTLLYLAHGAPRQMLALSFRMGLSTITKIIIETCSAIWDVLSPIHLPECTNEDWIRISKDFSDVWNMPNCCGAIDGKHVNIICPPNAGSEYYNYKHRHSIILMAVCDADYCFTSVDIGASGSRSDGGVFGNSTFGKKVIDNTLNLPSEKQLWNSNLSFPHYFVSDAAFPLRINLMRPFPGRNLANDRENFNYRLSRARRTIENAFGIMAARWRILLKDIHSLPRNAIKIVSATVILHNFLRRRCTKYSPPSFADRIVDDVIIEGEWRSETEGLRSQNIFQPTNNARRVAFQNRDNLCRYLSNEGNIIFRK